MEVKERIFVKSDKEQLYYAPSSRLVIFSALCLCVFTFSLVFFLFSLLCLLHTSIFFFFLCVFFYCDFFLSILSVVCVASHPFILFLAVTFCFFIYLFLLLFILLLSLHARFFPLYWGGKISISIYLSINIFTLFHPFSISLLRFECYFHQTSSFAVCWESDIGAM